MTFTTQEIRDQVDQGELPNGVTVKEMCDQIDKLRSVNEGLCTMVDEFAKFLDPILRQREVARDT